MKNVSLPLSPSEGKEGAYRVLKYFVLHFEGNESKYGVRVCGMYIRIELRLNTG